MLHVYSGSQKISLQPVSGEHLPRKRQTEQFLPFSSPNQMSNTGSPAASRPSTPITWSMDTYDFDHLPTDEHGHIILQPDGILGPESADLPLFDSHTLSHALHTPPRPPSNRSAAIDHSPEGAQSAQNAETAQHAQNAQNAESAKTVERADVLRSALVFSVGDLGRNLELELNVAQAPSLPPVEDTAQPGPSPEPLTTICTIDLTMDDDVEPEPQPTPQRHQPARPASAKRPKLHAHSPAARRLAVSDLCNDSAVPPLPHHGLCCSVLCSVLSSALCL